MKPGIKSVIWNIKKQKTPNQDSKKKKEPKNIGTVVNRFWDYFKFTNIHSMGVPEGKETE